MKASCPSHGCIRLPREFAQRLWGLTRIGAPVIIAHDDVVPSAIAHAQPFAPKPQAVPSAAVEPKVRFATVASTVDASLKGSIDANENARIESLIDRAVKAGLEAEAVADMDAAQRALDKGETPASAKDQALRPGPTSIYISRKTGRLYLRKGFEGCSKSR